MPTQVYAVVHDGKGNFLIAFKNERGYFFHDSKKAGAGEIKPKGQLLNGRSNWAFPGGGLKGEVIDGAVAEMLEETTVTLTADLAKPKYYTGRDKDWTYYGVYFSVPGDVLTEMLKLVQEKLRKAQEAAQAVIEGKYTSDDQYPALIKHFECPMDNELMKIYSWNLVEKWDEIKKFEGDKVTGWYFNILKNLRDTLL